jgi:hypothetical protein
MIKLLIWSAGTPYSGRVCLELHSVVGMEMLYKRWKAFPEIKNHVEVERTELTNELIKGIEMDFRRRIVRDSL